jgi:phosphoribosylamine--glycine ligase
MNILIVGSGGREHALAWKVAQSPLAKNIYVAPGNAGTYQEPRIQNIPLAAEDIPGLKQFALENAIGLTIVGPEAPLVAGITDTFQAAGLACFGPSQAAAQLEGSKAFSKAFMARHHIPTAASQSFTDQAEALAYLQQRGAPIVIKADGLAAGKGVVVAQDRNTAEQAVRDMLAGNKFGEAGHRVVIEDYLVGEEASFIAMVDGTHVLPMATSQDHKRVSDGDQGPNTGGMGAYSPAPVITEALHQRVMDEIMLPTIRGMAADGMPYVGFLYAGLMIDTEGNPQVIEYNCRFGDPETQPIMLRLQSDLVAHCLAALAGTLNQENTDWEPRPALGVVLAAPGYPGQYAKGLPMPTLPKDQPGQHKIFHAGTENQARQIVNNGGRIFCVTALGDDIRQAQQQAYQLIDQIPSDHLFCRRDIGYRAVSR